jgi:hypothetical protein
MYSAPNVSIRLQMSHEKNETLALTMENQAPGNGAALDDRCFEDFLKTLCSLSLCSPTRFLIQDAHLCGNNQ